MTLIARSLLVAMTASSGLPAPAVAAESPAAAPATSGCNTAQHRQFDFWLGEWAVGNPAGKLVGHSRIESILGGCVLLENWDSPGGISGKSFNIFNAETGKWEQFWVDNSGSRLHLSGGLDDGRMILQGVRDKPGAQTGRRQRERITWTPSPDGSVRQLWETSTDDGASWSATFDSLYRRRPATQAK